MVVTNIRHKAQILVGDYQFAGDVKREVLRLLPSCDKLPPDDTNVKSTIHSYYNWEPDNITFRNLKAYIIQEIETTFQPGARADETRNRIVCDNFWGMIYKKGDWANEHCHKPYHYSFAYFVKSKWYYSPLVFSESGKKIRPKEGRFVAFPGYLRHSVPKHRFNDDRITLSGNLWVKI